MPMNPPNTWVLRIATFAVWAVAAASLVYWGLRLAGDSASPSVAAPAQAQAPVAADPARVARLLGASAGGAPVAGPAVAIPSRFALIGVVASASRRGAALISVDGKPARPYRVGSVVETGYVLQAVGRREAVLAPSMNAPASVTLEMPLAVAAAGGASSPAPTRYVPPPRTVVAPGSVPARPFRPGAVVTPPPAR